MMGIIASARQLGITTIEVQHGQQGMLMLETMAGNFSLMVFKYANKFWCWGKIN